MSRDPYRTPGSDAPVTAAELKEIALRERDAFRKKVTEEDAGRVHTLEEVLKDCRVMAEVSGSTLFATRRVPMSVRAELEKRGFLLRKKPSGQLEVIWCEDYYR
jgi:hypothetical protein